MKSLAGRYVLTTSRKLAKHVGLAEFLDCEVRYAGSHVVQEFGKSGKAQAVLAWGRKPSTLKAEQLAAKLQLPIWRLEDGFIHSLGQGVLGATSCSLVLDQQGIYYDATRVSDIEDLLAGRRMTDINSESVHIDPLADNGLLQRADKLIHLLIQHCISKYNNAPLAVDHLNLPAGKKVLVVDQTAGDMSLKYGLVAEGAAEQMLQAARAEHPDATVLLKTHPDVVVGRKQGCFTGIELPAQVQVISEQVNPFALMAEVDHVYVLTSQLGFEALMLSKPVTCFGVPFYAGWGVTDDRADNSLPVFKRRTRQRSVTEIFAAAYLLYSRYVHPDTIKRCELEDIVAYIAAQQRIWLENQGRIFAFGFSRWKRNYIRRFLYALDNELYFTNTASVARQRGFDAVEVKGPGDDCHIVAWGERALAEAKQLAGSADMPVWRIEDGFIRSAGLGSDYTPPLSLVLDKRGIYYDPSRPSDLEYLLQNTNFTRALLERSEVLRQRLLKYAVSKYNLGEDLADQQIAAQPQQRVILVPGQVEDDASIRKGCPGVSTNSELLLAVRMARPDDYVVYKPHPDVVSGNRKGVVGGGILRQACDLVLEDVSVTDCLEAVDEVHTMTSLVGFEGLLRHKRVECYGLPFYAGWGLTHDHHQLDRRQRRLQLNELVAATLILYPRYVNWRTGAFTTPEMALDILQRQLLLQGGKKKNKIHGLQRLFKKAIHIYRGVFTFRY